MAELVTINRINEKPAITVTANGCVIIATRYQVSGSGLYYVVVYKKCPGDSSFSGTTIFTEQLPS